MKKVLLSVLFLATMSMSAQETEFESPVTKGRFNLAGNLSFSLNNSEGDNNESNYHQINFSPSLGYVIDDNLIIGVLLGIGYGENETNSTENNNINIVNKNVVKSYNAGVFVKKYIPLVSRLFFDVRAALNYSKNIRESTNYYNYDRSYKEFRAFVSPGLSYFLNKNLALQMNFGQLIYAHAENKNDETDVVTSKSNSFSLNLTSNTTLGVSYFF